MKERPILFSGEMVRQILAGRKTQTRRVIKPQTSGINPLCCVNRDIWGFSDDTGARVSERKCPYGQPGDRLWVRETWRETIDQPGIMYRADGWEKSQADYGYKWRPSIFMPRWASRITLEVKDIRVERVQDISHDDICAEGWNTCLPFDELIYPDLWFKKLWDSINAKRGYSWESNPWVWVVEFNEVQ